MSTGRSKPSSIGRSSSSGVVAKIQSLYEWGEPWKQTARVPSSSSSTVEAKLRMNSRSPGERKETHHSPISTSLRPTSSLTSGIPSRKAASQFPITTGQPSSRIASSASAGCGPTATSPRQTIRSTPSRSSSATTASSASRLPWMSEISPTRIVRHSRCLQALEVGRDDAEVLDEPLELGLAVVRTKDRRGMHRCEDDGRELGLDGLAAMLRHAELAPEERLRGRCAEAHEHAWLHDCELGLEPGGAGCDLGPARLLVDPALALRLPLEVLDDIRDVCGRAVDAGLLHRLVEEPP